MTVITLPKNVGVDGEDPLFLQKIVAEKVIELENVTGKYKKTIKYPIPQDVVFDLSKTCFVQPSGVTLLSNTVHWLKLHDIVVNFTGFNKNYDAHRFLDDSNFFEVCFGEKVDPTAITRGTTNALKVFDPTRAHAWLNFSLMPWLKRFTPLGDNSLYNLNVCLKELLNNIPNHSEQTIGSTFAQFFYKNKNVIISISDFGIGIPARVRSHLEAKEDKNFVSPSDSWCIAKACERGFTTQTSVGNLGVGLAYLIENVVNQYGGKVIILSDKAIVTLIHENAPIERINNWIYPGCLIEIHIPTNRIPKLDDNHEDYQWQI